jgi:hypothetical protein
VNSAGVPSVRDPNERKLKGAKYVARKHLVDLIAELHHPNFQAGSTDSIIRRSK